MMISIRSLTLVLSASLAGFLSACAVQPATHQQVAEYKPAAGFESATKRSVPREQRKRERAKISAQYHLEMEADENGPPSAAQLFRALAQRESLVRSPLDTAAKLAGVTSATWQELGPGNIGGRLRTIAIDPRNASRIFVGAASGGIWLSENAGGSWRPINDFLGSLSVTTLVFDPANPNIMFAGTGEGSAGLVGVGLFKSTDSGLTWNYLANTTPDNDQDWRFVNRIAIHPQQTNIMLVGTTNGNNRANGAIFRTIDGGNSWTKVATFKTPDIQFDPNNPSQAVAGREDGFISYSRDAGATWQATAQLVTNLNNNNTGRAEIAWSRGQPNLVYASIDHSEGQVWKSEDAGATWTQTANPKHLRDQGDYDNAIWADPTDSLHVITGGIDLYQSRDGGLNFTRISTWQAWPQSPHADQHAIAAVPGFSANNPVVYFGNDGGIYRADNIFQVNNGSSSTTNGWRNLNNGLGVTQFYGGAGNRAAGGKIIGGTQDNGSLQLGTGSNWFMWAGGDGGFSAVDPVDDRTIYGEYVYLSLHRSVDGGTRQYICSGITEGLKAVEGGNTYCGANATQKANFIAPFILDPNNRERMLAGANSLWVSNNVKAAAPSWTAIKPPIGGDAGTNYINAIAVAEGNANIVWVGHNGGQVFKSVNGLAAAPNWTQMNGLPSRQVARILIHPTNHNNVIVSYTGFAASNLWQTLDGGATWSSAIMSNLPAAPIFSVARHPNKDTWLYVGTSVGLFASENGGQSWSTSNDGPANVRVRDLFWYSNTELVAATYGRGMYKATINRPGPDNYQGAWWAGASENGWGLSFVQHGQTLAAGWYYFNAQGQPTWAIVPGCSWDASFTTCTGNVTASTGSWLGNYTGILTQNVIGTVTFSFTSATAGTMSWNIGGQQATKSISKINYNSGASPSGIDYTDIWWGGQAQNGWGVALLQQGGILAGSWYTYNQQNQPVWYLINGGSWTSPSVFTAPLTRATGSPLIGATYNPSALASTNAGTITITFTDAANATMNYTVDGVTQTKSITRLAF
ncbi:MAG: hypothetical protein JNM76_00305 [Betaproteobacteria bacterium]|nr:hypothetical protein [Betaproteobacteria bacterium]